ncbi:MAG: hypothetical protein ABN482_01245 [Corticimicrobacter sp.]|uniref:hypothetical protein n=1 Tax=Corticimicrobacter sp. TaxID=2678536 RepID=UPI0032D9DF33
MFFKFKNEKDGLDSALARGDINEICERIVYIAFYCPDWRWAQDYCLILLDYNSKDVKGVAATCLGHVARIHRRLDKDRVLNVLREHLSDLDISGQVEDAIDDIEIFLDG